MSSEEPGALRERIEAGDPDAQVELGKKLFTMRGPPHAVPNAVRWFAAEILPLVRVAVPDARFCIVGNHPTPAVRALGELPGVTVTGWVPDIRPYLAHAAVAVAPMRIARGIQNKVLEAMAMGKPVVVTSGALEGVEAVPGCHVLLADDPRAFAQGCLRLLGPDGAGLAAAARDLVVRHYDWSARLRALDDLLGHSSSGMSSPLAGLPL